jgi:hypothetical protein
MIVDGRGGAEVRCRESHEDHRPGDMCQGVMGVQVSTSSRCRVRESSFEECMVFRELCPCPRGASWLRPAWVR